MFKEHASREDGAAAEMESQTILSAQAGRVFNCEQFTLDGLRTLFRYVLERVEDPVTQLRDKTEHELYDRVRQEYGALKERLGHTEAAVSRLAEILCEVKCSLKEMERLRAHRGDATQTFEPAPTRHDPSRTLGYPASRPQQVLPAAEAAQGVEAMSMQAEDPFMHAPAFSSPGSALDLGRAD